MIDVLEKAGHELLNKRAEITSNSRLWDSFNKFKSSICKGV